MKYGKVGKGFCTSFPINTQIHQVDILYLTIPIAGLCTVVLYFKML